MYQDMIKKPIFHCCNHPEELIDNFVKTLYDIAQKEKKIFYQKNIIILLNDQKRKMQKGLKIGVL